MYKPNELNSKPVVGAETWILEAVRLSVSTQWHMQMYALCQNATERYNKIIIKQKELWMNSSWE